MSELHETSMRLVGISTEHQVWNLIVFGTRSYTSFRKTPFAEPELGGEVLKMPRQLSQGWLL